MLDVERPRPAVLDIPGVDKGAEVGLSRLVESAAERGEKRLQRDLYREREPKKGPTIRIEGRKTLKDILFLPKLVPTETHEVSIIYDEIGGVRVPFWQEVEVKQTEDGRWYIEHAEEFEQIRRERERRVDLNNLPAGRRVTELVLKRSPDIFTAMRQAIHVKDHYIDLGQEAQQLDSIWAEITRTRDLILGRQINKGNLEELAAETASILKKVRLTTAEKSAKVNILKRLMGIYQRDKLGRINPLVEMTRFKSAFLEAVGLEAFGVLVREKFTRIAGVLLMENMVTRQAMEDGVGALDTMMGFSKRGAYVFEGGKFHKGEEVGINQVVEAVGPVLRRARLSPYLGVARAAEIALWGSKPEEEELNRQILDNELAAKLLSPDLIAVLLSSDFVSATELIKQRKAFQAKSLTLALVVNPIKRLLAETAGLGFDYF